MSLSREWIADAACRGQEPTKFFVDARRHPAAAEKAYACCRQCAVETLCYCYSIIGDEIGIWGGTSERERQQRRAHILPLLSDLWPDLLAQWKEDRAVFHGSV